MIALNDSLRLPPATIKNVVLDISWTYFLPVREGTKMQDCSDIFFDCLFEKIEEKEERTLPILFDVLCKMFET